MKIIDIRDPQSFNEGHISGAKNIPAAGLMMNAENFLNKEDTYHLICYSGFTSSQLSSNLNAQGFKTVSIEGGMGSYQGELV